MNSILHLPSSAPSGDVVAAIREADAVIIDGLLSSEQLGKLAAELGDAACGIRLDVTAEASWAAAVAPAVARFE